MLAQTEAICNQAISLPPFERIEIIENLFFSLDCKDEKNNFGELFAEEVEDRLTGYENGEIRTVSAKEVFKKIDLMKKLK